MKKMNRWFYAAVGVITLFFAGVVYAWSTLSGPIAKEFPTWTSNQLSTNFTITMIMFCIGVMGGGFLAKKISAKIYVWVAAVLFLAGFFLASTVQTITMLYIGFGVICGLASGIAYSAVMGTTTKWFPDKQGLISGILLMGFGLSAFVIGIVYTNLTPDTIGAWRTSFKVLGVISAVALAICGFFFEKPGADFVPPTAAAKKVKKANPVAFEATTAQMFAKPQFWLYYVWAIVASAAGLIIVSQGRTAANEVGVGVAAGTIAFVVGLNSVANACGRIIAGILYDKFGRSTTMLTCGIGFIVTGVIFVLSLNTKSFALVVIGLILAGLSYGIVTPTNSAFISGYYGMSNFALNFSMINTNLVIASFGSKIAGALYDATGSYMSVYFLLFGMGAVSIVLSVLISICDKAQLAKKK